MVLGRRPRSVLRHFAVPRASAERRLVVADRHLVTLGDGGEAVVDLVTGRTAWSSAHVRGATTACAELAVSVPLGELYCGSRSGLVEGRDLATGVRHRLLDPQLGPVSQLLVVGDGRELVAFGVGRHAFARWRLDGPGAGGRVVADGAVSAGGYDPSGRLLLVRLGAETKVVDAAGSTRRVLPQGHATWMSPTTVGVARRGWSVLVDITSGRRTRIPLRDVDALYLETGGRSAWARTSSGQTVAFQRFAVPSGEPQGPSLPLFQADDASVASNGRRLLVTLHDATRYFSWWTEEYDIESGLYLNTAMEFASEATMLPSGNVVAVNLDGDVLVYHPPYGNPHMQFSAGRGAASSVEATADGRLVAVTSLDGTVAVFDLATGTRLGDPMNTGSPGAGPGSWLRPDGLALVTSTTAGVVEWDLDPEAMSRAACRLAGRNPTASEWAVWAAGRGDRRICPDLPLDVPVPPQET
jgi:hypothetical protein